MTGFETDNSRKKAPGVRILAKPCALICLFCLVFALPDPASAQSNNRVKDGFFGAAHDPGSIVSRKPSEVGRSVREKSSSGIGNDSFVVPRRARPKKAAAEAVSRQADAPGPLKSATPTANLKPDTQRAASAATANLKPDTQRAASAEAQRQAENNEAAPGSVQAIQEERRNNPYSRQMTEVRRAIRGESEDQEINTVVQDAKELSRRMNTLKSKAGAGRADPEYIRRATELVNEVVKSQPLRKRRSGDKSPGSNRF